MLLLLLLLLLLRGCRDGVEFCLEDVQCYVNPVHSFADLEWSQEKQCGESESDRRLSAEDCV